MEAPMGTRQPAAVSYPTTVQPPVERDSGDPAEPSGQKSASAIGDRIDNMILSMPMGFRCCCLAMIEYLGRGSPNCWSFNGFVRLLFGPLLYGMLFVPFVFAVLQQSAMNREAMDAFTSDAELSSTSWIAAFLFLGAVVLYVIIAFSALPASPFYDPGSWRLFLLLSAVIVIVWIQQALTFRYILMRPELSQLVKNRGERSKYHLCGRVYSTLNPRNLINYVYMTVIVSEFFVLASVCFHSNIPWKTYGARTEDAGVADWLQAVVPQALVGPVLDGGSMAWLVALLSICLTYVLLSGWCVYTRKPPDSLVMAFVCDGLAGALYTFTVGRLLLCAYRMDATRRFGRMLAMIAFLIFSTTAVFVATMRGDANQYKKGKMPDIRFLPKWLAAERILKGLVGIFAALLGNLEIVVAVDGVTNGTLLDSGIGSSRFVELTLAPKIGPILFVSFAILVTLAHLVLIRRWHPTCSVTFVTRTRTALLNMALLGQLITLSMLLMPWHGWLVVLIVSWSLCLIGLLCWAVYKVFYADPADEPEDMFRRRVRDAQLKVGNRRNQGARNSLKVALEIVSGVGKPVAPAGEAGISMCSGTA